MSGNFIFFSERCLCHRRWLNQMGGALHGGALAKIRSGPNPIGATSATMQFWPA